MDEVYQEVEVWRKKLKRFEENFKKCSKANRTKGYLQGRLSGLEELWRGLCEVDEKMELLKDTDKKQHNYFEDDQFGTMEEKFYQLKGEIKDQLNALEPKQQENSNQNIRQNDQHQHNQSNVKLPKISLPTFAGSYHTWMSFKNRFTSLIHSSQTLTDVEKLEYLKSCVTGKAEKAISRFQITDQNYQAAWDRLNDKYDNKRILQDTQIESIIDRKEIKVETAKEIRELLDEIQESLEALKNLEIDTKSWDPILVVLVKRKLPFKTREEWEKQLEPADVPTYKQLMDFLEKRYRTVENLELVGGMISENSSRSQANYNSKVNNQSSNHQARCTACNDNFHSLMTCETFLNMTTSNRSAFVNAKSLCRNCLAIGHMIRDCKSSKKCFKCNKSHHTLLHRDDINHSAYMEPDYSRKSFVTRGQSNRNYNPITPSNSSNPFSQYRSRNTNDFNNRSDNQRNTSEIENLRNSRVQQSHSNDSNQPSQLSQSSSSGNSNVKRNLTTIAENISAKINEASEKETLFPTAIIKFKSEGGVVYNLRALLDQCSEDVFIKESVANRLGRNQFTIPSFEVTGLEGTVTSRIEKATQVQMILDDKVLSMNASIVTTLVGMLPKTTLRWPKNLFENLKLADTNFATPNNVDIMLGTKAYTEILLDGVLKQGGYLAQNTKVGWIISGNADDAVEESRTKKMFLCLHTQKKVQPDEILRKFWEIEEPPKRKQKFTSDERKCEEVFRESYRTLSDGRPQVRLPFKENPCEALGESRSQAVARWLAMERKLGKDENLKNDYMKAIQEHLEPGHFLVGESLLAPPRPSLLEVHPNRLGVYKQMSQRVEHFAKRWKREYLSTLQHRPKWMRQNDNVEKGDMVLIKDDDYPPSQWKLGRVLEVFPDSDGLVRSAKVRTERNEFIRPIHKLSILPVDKQMTHQFVGRGGSV